MFNVSNRKYLSLAVLSGVLLLLSYPPFNLEFLAWIAFVPWLMILYEERNLQNVEKLDRIRGIILSPIIFWIGFMLGDYATLFLPSNLYSSVAPYYWVIVAVGVLLIIYSGLMKGFPSIMGFQTKNKPPESLSYLPARLPQASQIFIPAIMWTAAEFMMLSAPWLMKVFGGLGLVSIAKTQWKNIPLIQLASYTGMFGVTFLILLVNSAIAHAILRYEESKKISKPTLATLMACLLLFAALWMNSPDSTSGTFNVAVIHAPPVKGENFGDLYADLTLQALDEYQPDMVMWALWGVGARYGLTGPDPNLPSFLGPDPSIYKDLWMEHNVYLIGTSVHVYPDGEVHYMSTTYHVINALDGLIPPNFNLTKALFPRAPYYNTDFGNIGKLICQEGCFPHPTSQLVRDGMDFLVISTGEVSETFMMPEQFVSNAVYRAVEHRIPVVHVMNFKESVIVDPYGRVVNDVSTSEMAVGEISFSDEETFYTRYGDLFGWAMVGMVAVLYGYNFVLERRSPIVYCERCMAENEKDSEVCDECGASLVKPPLWKRILLHEYYEHVKKK